MMYVEKIPVKNKKKEVGIIAAYCRISKNVNVQLSSLEIHIIYFKSGAKKLNNLDLVSIYYDYGKSGLFKYV